MLNIICNLRLSIFCTNVSVWLSSVLISRPQECVEKWKVKLIFRGAYRLSGTAVVECLEIIDVERNLKQFDGLT